MNDEQRPPETNEQAREERRGLEHRTRAAHIPQCPGCQGTTFKRV